MFCLNFRTAWCGSIKEQILRGGEHASLYGNQKTEPALINSFSRKTSAQIASFLRISMKEN